MEIRSKPMSKVKKDPEREERITMEAIVDAYGAEEQAMGWYYYLDDRIQFPFTAKCIEKRSISPLKVGKQVTVLRMAPEEECEQEMFVTIEWEDEELSVPLMQLEAIAAEADSEEAVSDWHYWVKQGYEFG
jgi:Calcium binding